MSRVIKAILENCDGVSIPIEVSEVRNNKFGDYTSNVLLKNKLDGKKLMDQLTKERLFEKVETVNGHLNFFITSEIPEKRCVIKTTQKINRMKHLHDRLLKEKYNGKIDLREEWSPLVKQLNLLMATQEVFGEVTADEVSKLIKTFEQIDDAYIYRGHSFEALSGICKLFGTCLEVLERNEDEQYI